MEVKLIKYPTDEDWLLVKNSARTTIRMEESTEIPSTQWKTKILASEHSPIRNLFFVWEWIDLPSWVSVHFVRHKYGVEHFVSSQRNDRQKNYDRNSARQDTPVNHRCIANAQTIMNISKVRLCNNAAQETQYAWQMFLETLKNVTPELYKICVPTCIYRNGLCPEFKSCGYNRTRQFKFELEKYLENFEQSK